MEDTWKIQNDLEMRQKGKNKGPTTEVVNKSSKLPLFDGNRRFVDGNKQVGGNGVAFEKPR